jgi:hypothetical protein
MEPKNRVAVWGLCQKREMLLAQLTTDQFATAHQRFGPLHSEPFGSPSSGLANVSKNLCDLGGSKRRQQRI